MNPGQIPASLAQADPLLRAVAQVDGLHIVGGWLREAWFGRLAKDIDFVASGPLPETIAALESALGARSFSLNERFSTSCILAGDYSLDVSPVHPGGLEADLARRDYTINTLALPAVFFAESNASADEISEALLSHPEAEADLISGTLRLVSEQNLLDDPIRVLRGYRFWAQLDFAPTVETRAAWQRCAPLILQSAPERIHDELLRWFEHAPGESLRAAGEDGLLWQLFPQLADSVGCTQNHFHHLDVWEHTLDCMGQLESLAAALPPELAEWQAGMTAAWESPAAGKMSGAQLTRMSLLLHDIAKPATRDVQRDGRISFYGHQEVGARMVREVLDRLRFSSDERDLICLMVAEHLRLGYYSDHNPAPPRLVYRFLSRLGAAAPLMVLHSLADCAGTRGEMAVEGWEKHLRLAAVILRHHFEADSVAHPPLLLDGSAIMALTGFPPGPRIGELKTQLLEATAAGEVTCEAEARTFVLRQAAESASP